MQDDDKGALPVGAARPRLLDLVRDAIRRRHYSHRTEEAYVHWGKRFILFSGKRHPAGLGAAEVTAFLNHLVHERDVSDGCGEVELPASIARNNPRAAREWGWTFVFPSLRRNDKDLRPRAD